MSEVLLVGLIMLIVAACAFAPLGCMLSAYAKSSSKSGGAGKAVAGSAGDLGRGLPEDSILKRHFLTQLQSEIEATLFPRPTDSMLQRHYDSLVAAKVENRLQIIGK
ncbi:MULTISPECIES: hypothetical protein [Methylomonas]|uniref:Uncharacterized protein n=2 Tax=Methylomonas TaxID=416 RepID=A0A126T617_9GAMM|nr:MULTISPECIES: hypothetical protein [Methylomonas]AMK77515.1 hypothetical protein JT25_013655 [Methylomonas denitrificans]OAI05097.1 hypothetical protein A1342_11820 [Methylomonas methanica]TCV84443.1 hypothetical protein EDE11_107102 [Methylomonas methanica]